MQEMTYDAIVVGAVPEFEERVRAATRVERIFGTIDVPSGVRVPYGPGFALVGDAGLHCDPMMGQGITNAFRDAELLAKAIDRGLCGDLPMTDALRGYHETRDEAVLPMYHLICELVSYEPPEPEFIAAMEALPGNQRQSNRFVGVTLGTVRGEDLFSSENLASIVEEAREPEAVAV